MTSKAQKIHQQIQQKQQNKSKSHEQFKHVIQRKKCSILLFYLSRDWCPGLLTQQS